MQSDEQRWNGPSCKIQSRMKWNFYTAFFFFIHFQTKKKHSHEKNDLILLELWIKCMIQRMELGKWQSKWYNVKQEPCWGWNLKLLLIFLLLFFADLTFFLSKFSSCDIYLGCHFQRVYKQLWCTHTIMQRYQMLRWTQMLGLNFDGI